MNSKVIEDLEALKNGFSVKDELKKMIDKANESDKTRTYYMVSSPVQSKNGVPEQEIRIDSRARGTKLVLKENETLLYPTLNGIPLLVFKGLEWAKANGKEEEYLKEHSEYVKNTEHLVR